MDSSPNLISVRSSGCTPQNLSGSFEKPRTTRGDSKRARTDKSSSNGEVCTKSVLLWSFFALHFNTARRTKVWAIQIFPQPHPNIVPQVWEMIFLWALTDCPRGPDTFWYMNLNFWYCDICAWLKIQQVQQWQFISNHSRHLLQSQIQLHHPQLVPGCPMESLRR